MRSRATDPFDPSSSRARDDFNREGLGIELNFSLPAERVIRSLNRIIEWRGKPGAIRLDNGPEYISLQHIQPGQPQQNAYIERYSHTIRHDWLDQHSVETIQEARDFATHCSGHATTIARTWASAE